MLPEEIAYLHRVTRTLHQALLRIPELYLDGPAGAAICSGSRPTRTSGSGSAGPPRTWQRNPVFDRLDALVDFTSPVWKESLKFVEPNLTGVGGLHLVPAVEEVVDEVIVPLIAAQDHGLALRRLPDARELLFGESGRAPRGDRAPGRMRSAWSSPSTSSRASTSSGAWSSGTGAHHRIEVLHADPAELRLVGDEVYYEDHRVDLVYRDYSVLDLVDLEAEGASMEPMRRLFRENRVVSSIGAELDHKACWEVLTDPVIAERYFSEDERRVFQRHVLWTRVVGERRTVLPGGRVRASCSSTRAASTRRSCSSRPGATGARACCSATPSMPRRGRARWMRSLADEEQWVVQRLAPDPGARGADARRGRHPQAGGVLSRDGIRLVARRARDARAGIAASGGERGAARRHVRGDAGRRLIDKSTSVTLIRTAGDVDSIFLA